MKETIKRLPLLLALLLLLSACAGDSAPKSGTVSNPEPNEPSQSEPPEPSRGEPAQETVKPFQRGVVVGGTYINSFFGFACDLDENWTYCTKEEIAELNGLTEELLQQGGSEIDLYAGDRFTDMSAYADEGLVNINIQVQNFGVLVGLSITEEKMIDDMYVEGLREIMESSGYENLVVDAGCIQFLGEDHCGIHTEGQLNGTTIYQQIVYVKSGIYLATITFSSSIMDVTSEMLTYFSKI